MAPSGPAGLWAPPISATRPKKGLPTWRIVRYPNDFVVLVHAHQADVETLREGIARVLTLRLSPTKTRVVHMGEGFDFLGSESTGTQARHEPGAYEFSVVGCMRALSTCGDGRACPGSVWVAESLTIKL
jgi:RNA-directed DNA polymerase